MSEPQQLTKENLGDYLLEIISRMQAFDKHPIIRPTDVNFGVLPEEKEEMKKNATALVQNLGTLKAFMNEHPSDGLEVVIKQLEERHEVIEKKKLLEL